MRWLIKINSVNGKDFNQSVDLLCVNCSTKRSFSWSGCQRSRRTRLPARASRSTSSSLRQPRTRKRDRGTCSARRAQFPSSTVAARAQGPARNSTNGALSQTGAGGPEARGHAPLLSVPGRLSKSSSQGEPSSRAMRLPGPRPSTRTSRNLDLWKSGSRLQLGTRSTRKRRRSSIRRHPSQRTEVRASRRLSLRGSASTVRSRRHPSGGVDRWGRRPSATPAGCATSPAGSFPSTGRRRAPLSCHPSTPTPTRRCSRWEARARAITGSLRSRSLPRLWITASRGKRSSFASPSRIAYYSRHSHVVSLLDCISCTESRSRGVFRVK